MCSNYRPVTARDRLLTHFGVERPVGEAPPEFTFPGYLAPFVMRRQDREALVREAHNGLFGLLPHWAPDLAFGKRTYNARSETVTEKPSFRDAWFKNQRCIVPVEVIHEPCWETGKAVRWAISRRDGGALGVAGLWSRWRDKEGQVLLSFTMLTVNAEGHAIMQRMHRPGEEKRMVVILDEADHDAWLQCTPAEAHAFLRPYPAERLQAEPSPVPPRGASQAPLI